VVYFEDLVAEELNDCRGKHKPINSCHEGYAVLLEEVEEFWVEVMKKRSKRDKQKLLMELVQIATVAQRVAEDLGLLDCLED
jgi:hypothetical protein